MSCRLKLMEARPGGRPTHRCRRDACPRSLSRAATVAIVGKRRSAKRRGPGRPAAYAAKLGQAIAERLAGGEPLVSICTDASMPDRVTVWRWQLRAS